MRSRFASRIVPGRVAVVGVALLVCLFGGDDVAYAQAAQAAQGSPSAAGDSLCGPFGQPYQLAQASPPVQIRERGIVSPGTSGDQATGQGSIVRLAAPVPTASSGATPLTPKESEALLALPKTASGGLPTDLELGRGVRISQSFFSPVLCATLARVTGPPGATLDQLVTVVPDGSTVVPNDIYLSAADEIHPLSDAPYRVRPAAKPDPYVSLQYGLAISGVRAARELSAGGGVTIALLDSAADTGHRDLSGTRIKALPDAGVGSEPGVHGTLMAGVISAVEGNGFGIAGLAPESELISIPVCTPTGAAGGACTIFDLLLGLDLAWEVEADLVNLSLSGPANVLLERGVARLEALGVVVVAAAGNEGLDEERYPAAYPSVIGVGAIDREGQLFAASNRGDWVELLAPGVEILSTIPGDAFAFGNGTSLAAAHVTGELAVLTAAIGNAKSARAELFREASTPRARPASARSGPRRLPQVCDVFMRLELDCRAPNVGQPR